MSLLVLAGATLLGRLILTHFQDDLKANSLGLLGLSYAIGLGIYTWAIYVFIVVGGRATPLTLAFVGLALLGGAYLARKKRPMAKRFAIRFGLAGIGEWVLVGLLPLFAYNVYIAYWTPVYWSDSVYRYDGLGRILSIDGTLYSEALRSSVFEYGQPALLTQIIHAAAYLLGDEHVAIAYSGFYISLVLVFAFVRWDLPGPGPSFTFRRLLITLPHRLISLAIATVPMVFAMGYVVLTSLPGAVYFFVGVLAWKRLIQQPSRRLAILSGALFAMASWTRGEAFYFYLPVIAITLAMATVRTRLRQHLLAFLVPLLVLDASRYAFLLASGQLLVYSSRVPLPHLDLGLEVIALGYAAVVRWGRHSLREWLARGVVGSVGVGILLLIGVAVVYFPGVSGSATDLWSLISNPIWGITALLVAAAVFSPSLFRNTERLVFLVIVAFFVIRILLYSGLLGIRFSSPSVTHDGNRVLLYIWPLLFYWVSCSRELRGLFFFGPGTRRTRRQRARAQSASS